MFGTRWQLFRLLGIPIRVDASWLIILALLTWTLGLQFRPELPGMAPLSLWLLALMTALGFFLCIVLHELGHAVTARQLDISMNGITLFLFGGVAEMEGEPPTPLSEFLMAIAGPLVTVVLILIFGPLALLGLSLNWAKSAQLVCRYLTIINIGVLIFNMVPAFPLDGGRVLRSILWGVTGNLRRATHGASMVGQGFAFFLIGLGLLDLFGGDFVGGIWLGLIGLFLNNAARSSYSSVLLREALTGEPVSRFMNRHPIAVPPWINLRDWVEDYVYRYHRKMFPVVGDGRLEGVISTQALATFPREQWSEHTVAEAMRRDLDSLSITPKTDSVHALARMQSTGASRLLVVADGRLVGIVSLKDLLRFFHLKLELESADARRRSGPSDGNAPPTPSLPPHETVGP
ncbi:MAG TPA: site-2 protease family protein [Gemmataceae bacterium]|nr:site-2 protease family protein [Gemmataceae bacterium]